MRPLDYLLLLLLSGAYLVYFIRRKRKPPTARRRSDSRLSRREQSAWQKLQAGGYRLEEIHPSLPVTVSADDKKKEFTCDGDFLVSKGGQIYLVKVSRGGGVSISSPALRRELLLDCLLFQARGILLYDGEKERFQELSFLLNGGAETSRDRILWQAGLLMLIVIGIAFLYRLIFTGGGP